MTRKKLAERLEHWRGAITVLAATAAPFGAWAMEEATLKASIVLGVLAGLGAIRNWLDGSLTRAQSEEPQE